MEKLGSGLRINRAADDAAGLGVSDKMRAQIRGLQQASQNIQDGISLSQIADGGLDSIHSVLHRAQQLAVQASNGILSDDDRRVIQLEIDEIKSTVDSIANETNFNGLKLLNGEMPPNYAGAPQTGPYDYANVLRQPPVGSTGNFDFHTNAGYPTTTEDDNKRLVYGSGSTSHPAVRIDGTSYDLRANTTITNTTEVGGTYNTVYTIPSKNVQVTQSIRTVQDKYEITYSITNNDLVPHSIGFQFHMDVMLGGDDSAPFVVNNTPVSTQTVYTGGAIPNSFIVYNAQGTGSGVNAQFQGAGIINGPGILVQPDKFAIGQYSAVADWNFNSNTGGVGDSGYSIWWNERPVVGGTSFAVNTFYGQSVPPTVADPTTAQNGGPYDIHLQVGSELGERFQVWLSDVRTTKLGIADMNVLTIPNAQKAIRQLETAVQKVTKDRSRFGEYHNALEHINNNVKVYHENLSSTESRIRDTDMAKEMVELTKNSILTEAAQAVLSQANQQSQGVLQIIK